MIEEEAFLEFVHLLEVFFSWDVAHGDDSPSEFVEVAFAGFGVVEVFEGHLAAVVLGADDDLGAGHGRRLPGVRGTDSAL